MTATRDEEHVSDYLEHLLGHGPVIGLSRRHPQANQYRAHMEQLLLSAAWLALVLRPSWLARIDAIQEANVVLVRLVEAHGRSVTTGILRLALREHFASG